MSEDVRPYFLLAAALGIAALLWFLGAMWFREAVKRDLWERGCEPLHIWWIPFAYWATGWWNTISFRVIYKDAQGRLHKAYCCVYQKLTGTPFGPLHVEWVKDELRDFIDV